MKILVTGGTGYIGSHTAVELIKAGHTVEILDNLYNSKETVLDQIAKITGTRPKFHKVDLLDYPATLETLKNGFDAVMHFAGLKAVAESVEKPLLYYENNISGTLNLLKAMQETETKNLIFSSSATVYGDQGVGQLDESMETGRGITNPYGQTKFMIEQIIKDVCLAHPDFSAVLLRYFNPVGAHPSGLLGEDPNGIPNNLMPIVMKVAKGEIPELSIYGDDYPTPDGTCIRDYIHVVDLAKGHLKALEKIATIPTTEPTIPTTEPTIPTTEPTIPAAESNAPTAETSTEPRCLVYNLGTGRGTSVLEMVKAFEQASGEKLPCRIAPRRPGDLAELCAVPDKAKRELNWQAELQVADAMKDTLNFLKKSQE